MTQHRSDWICVSTSCLLKPSLALLSRPWINNSPHMGLAPVSLEFHEICPGRRASTPTPILQIMILITISDIECSHTTALNILSNYLHRTEEERHSNCPRAHSCKQQSRGPCARPPQPLLPPFIPPFEAAYLSEQTVTWYCWNSPVS